MSVGVQILANDDEDRRGSGVQDHYRLLPFLYWKPFVEEHEGEQLRGDQLHDEGS